MKIIEQELGGPVENFYSYLSEEPVAAASFGQVYQGRTLDGCSVAIKVQRPNMLHSVVRDIYILRLGLDILRKVAKRKSDLRLYADELGKGLVGELDYKIEAANASEFLDAHSQYSFMSVPRVLGHLTRKRVLTMEWMVGESPNTLLLQARGFAHEGEFTRIHKLESKRKLLDLVSKGAEATLVQLLETGLLHADPHPGNLRYTPEGCIGFLDFGLLCRMKKEHQIAMLASIIHIVNGDWGALVYDLTSMDVVRPGTNLRSVTKDFVDALGEVNYIDGIPDIKFSLVLGKILSIALKYQFRMPPYYTLVLRSLASLEGLAVAADQKFQTFRAAYPYVVKKLLYDNSKAARRILYSVVFNNRREIQWKKILLFLEIGSFHSVGSNMTIATNMIEYRKSEQDIVPVLNFVSSLLLSQDGIVLRRLMMTADAISLTRMMISKDATLFRQQIGMFVADAFYRWMHEVILGNKDSSQNNGLMPEVNGKRTKILSLSSSPSPYLYDMLRDRRIKVIFYSKLSQVRKHPILMLRACWSCFTVLVMAFMIALHKFTSRCFEGFLDSLSFVPKPIAVSL